MATKASLIDFLAASRIDARDGDVWDDGAIVAFFETGTSTGKAVWTDRDKSLPTGAGITQTTLGSDGTVTVFGDGVYDIKIYDKDDSGLTTPLKTFSGVSVGDVVSDQTTGSAGTSTAYGYLALAALTSGATNVAVGYEAGNDVTTGQQNTLYGYQAGDKITSGQSNIVIGASAAGALTTGNNNIAIGFESQNGNISTGNLVAIGYQSLKANVSGTLNTAVGYQAGLTATGSGNTMLGHSTDTATGSANTVIGYSANSNGSQSNGVAIGYNAECGEKGVSVGYDTGYGTNTVVVGYEAGKALTTHANNSGVGYQALLVCTGAQNTALGSLAGSTLTTGSNNTLIGYNAAPSAVDTSNEFTLGNGSVGTLRCQQTTITGISDERDKKDIETIPVGLDFVNALRPVRFTWNCRDGAKVGIKAAGFIAQELDIAQSAFNAEEYLNLVYKANPDKLEATIGNLLPVLVKAIQELSAENESLKSRLDAAGL